MLSSIHLPFSTTSKSHRCWRQYLTSESGGFNVSVIHAEAQPQSLMIAAMLQTAKQAAWEYLQNISLNYGGTETEKTDTSKARMVLSLLTYYYNHSSLPPYVDTHIATSLGTSNPLLYWVNAELTSLCDVLSNSACSAQNYRFKHHAFALTILPINNHL